MGLHQPGDHQLLEAAPCHECHAPLPCPCLLHARDICVYASCRAADLSVCAPYFSQIASRSNVLVDAGKGKVYTYFASYGDFFKSSTTCSNNVPHPSIQWHSTLFVPNTYAEQRQVGATTLSGP